VQVLVEIKIIQIFLHWKVKKLLLKEKKCSKLIVKKRLAKNRQTCHRPSTNTDEKEEEKTEAAANEEELMADNKRKDMSEVVDEDLNMKKQKIEEGEAQIEDSKPAAVEV